LAARAQLEKFRLTGEKRAATIGGHLARKHQVTVLERPSMRIRSVTPLLAEGSIVGSWVFARVETEDGVVGYGEGTRHAGPVIAEAIKWLEPVIAGESPYDIEMLYNAMHDKVDYVWGAVFSCAMSAIESALWDIVGKDTGRPVHDLIGGRTWESCRLYTHIGGGSQINRLSVEEGIRASEDFDAIGRRAEDLKRRGFTAVKTFTSDRYDRSGRAKLIDFKPNLEISLASIKKTAKKVEFLRRVLGDEVEIAIDVHGLNVASAVRLGQALEPYGLMWYEEPVPPFNYAALKQVREQVRIPICMSERLHETADYSGLIQSGLADLVMIDPQWCGGVMQSKRIAAMAQANHMSLTIHNCNSPLASVINAHIAMSTPNFTMMEFMDPDVAWCDEVLSEPLAIKDGQLVLNGKPGWGIDLNERALARHPYVRGKAQYEVRWSGVTQDRLEKRRSASTKRRGGGEPARGA